MILNPYISRKPSKILINRKDLVYVKFKDLQILYGTFLWYLERFLRYFEKTVFEKVCQGLGVSKTS